MGEVIKFPAKGEDRDPRDISETELGQRIISDKAAPVFRRAIDEADRQAGAGISIDLEAGEWEVIPLGDNTPEAS
jgi:hypothetical protein